MGYQLPPITIEDVRNLPGLSAGMHRIIDRFVDAGLTPKEIDSILFWHGKHDEFRTDKLQTEDPRRLAGWAYSMGFD